MKLLVVILNYKVTDLTIDCLRSIAGMLHRVPETRVAVCENGTGGDAPERLRQAIDEHGWGGWVDLTVVHPNRGFTGGNNLLIRAALASPDQPEYILLLNADTVVHDHSFEALVQFMDKHPRAGIAGSKLVWPEGGAQGTPFCFFGIGTEFQSALRLGAVSTILRQPVTLDPKPDVAACVDWVSGASMILRRTMLDGIGLLDEGLYTYFDDIDICLRARRAGWETWFVPASVVTHFEGRSTGIVRHVIKRRPDYWFQARRRFWLKNHGPLYTLCVDAAFILGFGAWRVRRLLQRHPDTDPPDMLADFVRNSVFRTGFELREVENPALREETLSR